MVMLYWILGFCCCRMNHTGLIGRAWIMVFRRSGISFESLALLPGDLERRLLLWRIQARFLNCEESWVDWMKLWRQQQHSEYADFKVKVQRQIRSQNPPFFPVPIANWISQPLAAYFYSNSIIQPYCSSPSASASHNLWATTSLGNDLDHTSANYRLSSPWPVCFYW